jgi:glutathione S-transferase
VPVLREDRRWFTDSLDIAKHADRIGRGETLFPPPHIAEIELWNRRSDIALAAGRAIALLAAASHPQTARAMVPKPLRGLLGPLAEKGLSRFIDKYRMREDAERHEQTLEASLAQLETALAGRSGHLIGDRLTYADIAMAVAVQLVVPVDSRYMPAAPPGVTWRQNQDYARRFANLTRWRDDLYAKHRRKPSARTHA